MNDETVRVSTNDLLAALRVLHRWGEHFNNQHVREITARLRAEIGIGEDWLHWEKPTDAATFNPATDLGDDRMPDGKFDWEKVFSDDEEDGE